MAVNFGTKEVLKDKPKKRNTKLEWMNRRNNKARFYDMLVQFLDRDNLLDNYRLLKLNGKGNDELANQNVTASKAIKDLLSELREDCWQDHLVRSRKAQAGANKRKARRAAGQGKGQSRNPGRVEKDGQGQNGEENPEGY